MINKVFLLGNLGRNPVTRQTQSGTPVASFSVATNRRWQDREGNRQEQTEWHNIVCFGRQAEIAGQYLTVGKQVFIEGRIQTSTWQDKATDERRSRTEIVSESFQMLGNGNAQRAAAGDLQPVPHPEGSAAPPTEPLDDDDDIPF